MSVQLILYPQTYEGQYNSISANANEFVVNGINFSNLSTSSSYTTSATTLAITFSLIAQPAVTNTWVRYRSIAFGTPALPTDVANNVVFNSGAFSSRSGIYQKLSNLVIGTNYTITINVSTTGTGSIHVGVYNISSIVTGQTFSAATSTITKTFTANSATNTLVVSYLNTVATNVTVSDISVVPSAISPSGAIQLLEDGQVICDLYEDEDLPLTLSVDDFKNVAEKVQSYSKAFNLPSTKRNNKIFNAIFEVTRENDGLIFNPYKRTKCVLKQDGFILFEGYLRMLDVTDKEGEISYNVNLYSEVIALADTLKDRAFRDLDFTELEHDYNRTQIKNSWNDATTGITYTNPSTSGFRDAYSTVKYPFVDWTHQIINANNPGAPPLSGPADGNPQLTSLETAFRPFINIKYLIDRIFDAPNTPFTYESAFFNTTDFGKLYMDFNWGANEETIGMGKQNNSALGDPITTSAAFPTWTNLRLYEHYPSFPLAAVGYDETTGILTATADDSAYSVSYSFGLTKMITSAAAFRWVHKDASGNEITEKDFIPSVQYTAGGTSGLIYSGYFTILLQNNETLEPQFLTLVAGGLKQKNHYSYCTFGLNPSLITTNTLLQTLRGELGQWDFLKGLITMFNLVTLVDEDNPNNILIEPYSDVFIPTATGGTTLANRGIEHDWTDKIDVSEMKLTPLTDLNKKTIFKFVEDDDDYAFNNYKNLVGGHLYGSKKFNAGNEFNILDGEEEVVAEPFAATLVKPLMSQYPSFIVPFIYAMGEDGVSEGFENSPRIMYNNGIKSTGTTYYIPEQNGVVSSNEPNFLQFSHLTEVPTSSASPSTTIDFHFDICQLMPGVGSPTPNNLFNLYWLPYYSELYNPNTRTMTLKVNLSPADINTFRFNDRVFIKNRVFRVNKIDYKPNDLATVEFILIP